MSNRLRSARPCKPLRKRRRKSSTLARALREAERAGVTVASASVDENGTVSLMFGEAKPELTNDLDRWMAKNAH